MLSGKILCTGLLQVTVAFIEAGGNCRQIFGEFELFRSAKSGLAQAEHSWIVLTDSLYL